MTRSIRSICSDETCDHGYARAVARVECPRCGDRPDPAPPSAPRLARTRWHATATTLGPAPKIAITLLIGWPIVHMAYLVTQASEQPVYTIVVVPLAGLVLFAARFLPELWEHGQMKPPGRQDETGARRGET